MAETRFVYFSGFLADTVTDSQIINWLELYQNQGITFDLILMTGLKSYFADRETRKNKIHEAKEKLNGKVYDVFSIKPELPIYQVMVFCVLCGIFLKDFLSGSTIVLQARSASASTALGWLKRIYPKLKIIYDVRGATAEEFVNQYRQEDIPLTEEVNRTYLFKLGQELSFLDISDRVFCVSKKLKEYFFEKKQFPPEKFKIVPCFADEKVFFFDRELGDKTRKNLGIADDRIVFLYSGGLNKPWQIPEFVFELVSELIDREPKIFFLCLTPELNIAEQLIERFGIGNADVWTGFINYQDINSFLNAADMGLLLREDSPTNNVASPTKFAEYILAGLPTIISQGIGDLSGFVLKNPQVGSVVNNDSADLADDVLMYLKSYQRGRDVVASVGKSNFAKNLKLNEVVGVYKSFC